jgi:V8-like Glu-specific endopeptidase
VTERIRRRVGTLFCFFLITVDISIYKNDNMLALLFICITTACYVATTPITNAPFEIVSAAANPRLSLNKHISDIVNFWTDEKLKAAKPVMRNRKIGSQLNTKIDTTPDGPPISVNGLLGSLQKATETTSDSDRLINKQVFGYTGRQTYTTGKIFWNITSTTYGMCSGAVVTAGNKDTIVTAGHCCFNHDTNKWYINQNFIFIPGYKSGARPYGTWAARLMTAYTTWTANQNYNYDVCFVNLYTNSKGQHIQDSQGAEGIGYNYPRNALVYSFGYPYNLAQGEIMQYCSGKTASSVYGNGYVGQTISCDMTGGCSGGPWLQNFDISSGNGYITSLNSFTINSISNHMNGPYFDSNIWSLYQQCIVK